METENLKLKKPGKYGIADIEVIDKNMDIIDNFAKEIVEETLKIDHVTNTVEILNMITNIKKIVSV